MKTISMKNFKGVVLSRSITIDRIDLLRYMSKTVTIVTQWKGGTHFIIRVIREKDKLLVEQVQTKGGIDHAEDLFESLKVKYIFDYDKALL